MKYKELLRLIAAWDGPDDAEVFFVNYGKEPVCKDHKGNDVYEVTSIGIGIGIGPQESKLSRACLVNNAYQEM